MTQEFIPYEQALELKQLGFNEPCFGEWQNLKIGKNLVVDEEDRIYDVSVLGADIKAPLYQQAFRWFRDKKLSDSYVYRYQDRTDGSINYGYSIIHDYGIEEIRFIKENYTSYEEAELTCLKKLIEIVKNK
jgi:hypothetical protein